MGQTRSAFTIHMGLFLDRITGACTVVRHVYCVLLVLLLPCGVVGFYSMAFSVGSRHLCGKRIIGGDHAESYRRRERREMDKKTADQRKDVVKRPMSGQHTGKPSSSTPPSRSSWLSLALDSRQATYCTVSTAADGVARILQDTLARSRIFKFKLA